jgi:isopenicillin N synthase-like dioxygenase
MDLVIHLHRAIAIDLGVDIEYFTPFFTRMVNLRLLHYPPHPEGRVGWGIAPHTDFGNLTLLAQDNAGLELCTRDGTWLPTQVRADALMCNIGDCLMRWSNDEYVSTPHRVYNSTGRDRHSVVLFGDVDGDTIVSCLPSCEGPDRPAKHSSILFADFARSKFASGYD